MKAFTANMDVASSPEIFYANVDTKLNLMKNSTYVTTTLMADLVIVCRSTLVTCREFISMSSFSEHSSSGGVTTGLF